MHGLAACVIVCVVGAGLALFAASRAWTVTLTARPAPLPPAHASHTGNSLVGWLTAIALVGLAGAGALLATRGGARVLIGALLGLVGLAVLGAGVDGLRLVEGARFVWPVLVMIGGVGIATSGLAAIRRGRSWAAMGVKYELPGAAGKGPATDATMWDDLDRGVDPTARD
jgi:hypothetical protein